MARWKARSDSSNFPILPQSNGQFGQYRAGLRVSSVGMLFANPQRIFQIDDGAFRLSLAPIGSPIASSRRARTSGCSLRSPWILRAA